MLSGIESSNISRIESIASSSSRFNDIVHEIPAKIYPLIKKMSQRGTILDLKDGTGKITYKRVLVPKGYRNTQKLIWDAYHGKVDISQWGYSSPEQLEQVINNVNKYINPQTESTRAPSLIFSDKEFVEIGNGIRVDYDSIGFPIFRGRYVKTDFNISDEPLVRQLGGLNNMSSDQHMLAATRKFRQNLINENNTGLPLKEYLVQHKGYNNIEATAIMNAFDADSARISGFRWHHHQETGRMQLVEEAVHTKAKHNGGNSLWGKGSVSEIDD